MKRWIKLGMAKYRWREGLFLAEGQKVVEEMLRSSWPAEALLVLEDRRERMSSLLQGVPAGIPLYSLPRTDWDRLGQDETPEGIMAIVSRPPQQTLQEVLNADKGHLLLLHEINNPNNLGAILRASRWFGFDTVLLSDGSVEATHPKAVRASMGSLFHLNILDGLNFTTALPIIKKHCLLIATDPHRGVLPHACGNRTALILGSESHGLPKDLSSITAELWRIPGGGIDSLSLPQAAAIMMYACTRTDQE